MLPPSFGREYGEKLGDAEFWGPYVRAILTRHRLGDRDLESGFVGTYPTFLAGDVVVKLVGYFGSWRDNYDTELAMQQLLAKHPEIPAPQLIAHGQLFNGPEPWPYLVTSLMPGRASREVGAGPTIAARLGEVVRALHEIAPPDVRAVTTDWLVENWRGCVDRQRRWGSLPPHLIEQIESYVVPPSSNQQLIHADLTGDHVFCEGGRLVGIIDWGDAFATDRHYELAALHVDCFRRDRELLRVFLDSCGWKLDARQAMSAALMHRFDVFVDIPAGDFATLDEVAEFLWDTSTV